jgi:putative oxidoreductase
MTRLYGAAELIGRILLMALFSFAAFTKLTSYGAIEQYMASAGVPPMLLPLVIVLESVGTVVIVLGWRTRVCSLVLAAYTFATAILFHVHFADQVETIMFLKNLSISGALLVLAANGAGPISFDARKQTPAPFDEGRGFIARAQGRS